VRTLGSVVSLAAALIACEDSGGTDPGALRFGQLGRIEIQLEAPLGRIELQPEGLLRPAEGQLKQALVWSSSGTWTLRESVS